MKALLMRKSLQVTLSLLVMAALVLGACSKGTNTASPSASPTVSGQQSETATPGAQETVTIRVAMQGLTPTDDKTPTEQTPNPRLAMDKVVADFERDHPHVKVELLKTPISQEEYLTWMTTRIASGDAPDVAWPTDTPVSLHENGWLLPLDDYFAQPNPYNEPGMAWQDTFTNPELLVKFGDGKRYMVPMMQAAGSAVTFFYNIDIFDELGIGVPRTWAQLLDGLQKAKDAGYTPAVPTVYSNTPTMWQLGEQASVPILNKFLDEFNYTGAQNATELKGDEYVRMIKNGTYAMDIPEFREVWQLYKQWTQMWPKGWATQDMMPLWREGKAAIREGGMWELQSELSDTNRTFKWGIFPMPPVASDSSPNAIDYPRQKGFPKNTQATINLSVIKPAVEKNGTLEQAIAFLHYLSKADVNEYVVNEIPMGRPTVNGAMTLPLFDAIKEAEYPVYPDIKIQMNVWLTGEVNNAVSRYTASWINNEMDDETFFGNVQKSLAEGADSIISSQNLDTSKW